MPKKETKLPEVIDKEQEAKKLKASEEIALKAISFFQKKDAIKTLGKQCKELRVPLEEFMGEFGKTLPNGSILCVIPHADVEAHLKNTLRVGKVLQTDAEAVIRKNKLAECLETVTIIREDVLEGMYKAGKVSDDVLSKIYASKETYAFSVDVKERTHE